MMKVSKSVKGLASYTIVGGMAALVEWLSFFTFDKSGLHYLGSTALSFLIATFVNWYAGRKLTFKNSPKPARWYQDLLSVYFASAFGLLLSMGFMYLLVSVMHLHSMTSKIISTGLVFSWNYLIRKYVIYKEV